jgi:cytidylate kinase/aminoglycoside phosphotransferase (APT) family kinase protein
VLHGLRRRLMPSATTLRVKQAVTTDIVAGAARTITGEAPSAVVELLPRGTLRSFRVDAKTPLTIRVDEDPAGRRVDVEARAFVALLTATDPPVVPTLRTRHVLFGKDGIERRFLAYDWVDGKTLEAPLPRSRAKDVGVLFSRLHGARVLDLWGRLPEGPMSLMDTYRKTVEELRSWVALREQDGLGHDLLTLSLSDMQRSLRQAIVAQDNAFRTARRRVLCHGAAEPAYIIARPERSPLALPLCLVGLDRAVLGDAAFDLARFTVAADMDDDAEDELLHAYVDGLAALDRADPRFVTRYFACRTLELLARPIARLERIARIKRGTEAVLDDPITVLENESDAAATDIARAMTALRALSGRARATTAAEVKAMGRIVALEDMVLAGRTFRLALTGEPYTGKTEVGALVARRLGHRFFGTGALSRALAIVERRERQQRGQRELPSTAMGTASSSTVPTSAELSPRALVKALFERGFTTEPLTEPPFYRVSLDGEDITDRLREADADLTVRAGTLLDDESVRQALKDELERRYVGEGLVVEGLYAESLLGSRVKAFHLTGDVGVRRARLMAHRADSLSETDVASLLARLDAEAPGVPREAISVDVGSRPAAAAALALLVHLLPASRRPAPDLSNRAPL